VTNQSPFALSCPPPCGAPSYPRPVMPAVCPSVVTEDLLQAFPTPLPGSRRRSCGRTSTIRGTKAPQPSPLHS